MSPYQHDLEIALDEAVVFVMAGGESKRLRPLTDHRSKPEVVFGGKYRIIDFVLANCMHSGLNRIIVVPQYKHYTLGKHLSLGWNVFNPEKGEYLMFCPPQGGVSDDWYKGTADSIYHSLDIVAEENPKYIIVASGDAVYQMDYRPYLEAHVESGAELTIAAYPVARQAAIGNLGVLEIDANQQVQGFIEKPNQFEIKTLPDQSDMALSSMGIYIFNSKVLIEELQKDNLDIGSGHDFGVNVIPAMIRAKRRVFAYVFSGYWRDVGTIDSYYEANMDLLAPVPPFDVYNDPWFWRTRQKQLPSTKYIGNVQITNGTIVGDGCLIEECCLDHSIISPKSRIGRGAKIIDSILMDGAEVGPDVEAYRTIMGRRGVAPAGAIIRFDTVDRNICHVTDSGIVVVPEIREPWLGR